MERRNPDIPVRTPEQLITLASIIEKETGKADERSRLRQYSSTDCGRR